LNDGELEGVRILGRKSVELMRTPRVDWDDDGTRDFGLGFMVVGDLGGNRAELGSVGAYSWGGAFYTTFWIDPSEGLVAILMSQGRPVVSDIDAVFRTLVYQSLE
jgi:CubicO group peptidase (beta-lactamase class C family)